MPDAGQQAVNNLVGLLDLEQIETDIFRGGQPPKTPINHVFGGQVAAQALTAAGRTVEPDRFVHSLHAYFIRPGDGSIPIVFTVTRSRDGRSFTTRRVVAIQHGKEIFALEASFQVAQPGIEHQLTMPSVPSPESLAPMSNLRGDPTLDRGSRTPWPFDRRAVPHIDGDPPVTRFWIKASGRLPDDPLLNACVLTYASDLTPAPTVLNVHGLPVTSDAVRQASLDHAVWFHRPCRADEWLLFVSESPSASGSRGLAICHVFTADGRQVATYVQEAMIRLLEVT